MQMHYLIQTVHRLLMNKQKHLLDFMAFQEEQFLNVLKMLRSDVKYLLQQDLMLTLSSGTVPKEKVIRL